MKKVQVDDSGCFIWQASRHKTGYGLFGWRAPSESKYRMHLAHRVAWLLMRGEIPEGKEMDHLCRVRACVNPEHLEPVTRSENIRRGIGPELTRGRASPHCKNGHVKVEQGGRMQCPVCKRQWLARYRKGKQRPKRTPEQLEAEREPSRARMRRRREKFYSQGLNSRGLEPTPKVTLG